LVATAQIKEHIKPERLLEILNIEPEVLNFEFEDFVKTDVSELSPKVQARLDKLIVDGVSVRSIIAYYAAELA
jgi:hypothetical protein